MLKRNTVKKKLILIIPVVLIVALASVLAIFFGTKKKNNGFDTTDRVTTYEYLPLVIEDGVVKEYTGANDGTVELEIPTAYVTLEDGTLLPSNQNNGNLITKIDEEVFKGIKFRCLTVHMDTIEEIGDSAFEDAENIYFQGGEQGYVIGNHSFKNAKVFFDDIYIKSNGTKSAIGVGAFDNVKVFNYREFKAELSASGTEPDGFTLKNSQISGGIVISSFYVFRKYLQQFRNQWWWCHN